MAEAITTCSESPGKAYLPTYLAFPGLSEQVPPRTSQCLGPRRSTSKRTRPRESSGRTSIIACLSAWRLLPVTDRRFSRTSAVSSGTVCPGSARSICSQDMSLPPEVLELPGWAAFRREKGEFRIPLAGWLEGGPEKREEKGSQPAEF